MVSVKTKTATCVGFGKHQTAECVSKVKVKWCWSVERAGGVYEEWARRLNGLKHTGHPLARAASQRSVRPLGPAANHDPCNRARPKGTAKTLHRRPATLLCSDTQGKLSVSLSPANRNENISEMPSNRKKSLLMKVAKNGTRNHRLVGIPALRGSPLNLSHSHNKYAT